MPPALAAQLDGDRPPRMEGDPGGSVVRPQVPVEGKPVDQKRRAGRNMGRLVDDIGAIQWVAEVWLVVIGQPVFRVMPLNEKRTKTDFTDEVRADFDKGFAD